MSARKRQPAGAGRAAPRRGRTSSAASEASKRELARATLEQQQRRYSLRLYVTGTTPASSRAIEKVRSVCEEYLHGRYDLEVLDIYQMPALAKDQQIIATPTLIKVLPLPLRRFIGDLSTMERVLFGLDLLEKR
jgi:circadian clock protein KaiB